MTPWFVSGSADAKKNRSAIFGGAHTICDAMVRLRVGRRQKIWDAMVRLRVGRRPKNPYREFFWRSKNFERYGSCEGPDVVKRLRQT